LSCTPTHLIERVDEAQVRIPVNLGTGRSAVVDGATVRRIAPPQRSAPGALWFSVARNDTRLFALRKGVGVEQIRMPAPSGTEILTAVARAPAEAMSAGGEADQLMQRAQRYLNDAVRTNDALRDSLAQLADRNNARIARLNDSIQTVLSSERVFRTRITSAASRMIADSALRLPSEEAVRERAWVWPGAGQFAIGRGGLGWGIGGGVAAAAVAAGALLPDRTLDSMVADPDIARPALVVGGAATWLTLMLLSRARLGDLLQQERAAHRTRESFLQNAYIEVSPTGTLQIRFTTGTR
jgi:hypothetical protein